MRGRAHQALDYLDNLDQDALRSLKIHQYWAAYVGLIKLRRAVLMDEFSAAELLLQQLSSLPHIEPDCHLELSLTRLDLLVRTGNFPQALALSAQIHDDLVRDNADVYHRVRVMVLRAQIFGACGRPLKGLSISINAASIAWKARLMPAVFSAFHAVAGILVTLEEYQAAYRMLDCIMPQVLECEDVYLAAQCFAVLADIEVGLAGKRMGVSRDKCLHNALDFLDRAFSRKSFLFSLGLDWC